MMFGADKTVTVINQWVEDGVQQYACHTFAGCSWFEIHAASATNGSGGYRMKSTIRVRIPAQEGFLPPGAWAALPNAEKPSHWTLGKGARLVLGIVTPEQCAALPKHLPTAACLGWHDNRAGRCPHFYVEGG